MTFQFGLGSVLCSAQINLKPGKLVHTSYKINQNRGFRQLKGDSVGDLSHTVTYFLCHTPWHAPRSRFLHLCSVSSEKHLYCKSMQFYAFGCWKVVVRISKHWHYILSHSNYLRKYLSVVKKQVLHFYKVSNRTKQVQQAKWLRSKSCEKGSAAKSYVLCAPKGLNFNFESLPLALHLSLKQYGVASQAFKFLACSNEFLCHWSSQSAVHERLWSSTLILFLLDSMLASWQGQAFCQPPVAFLNPWILESLHYRRKATLDWRLHYLFRLSWDTSHARFSCQSQNDVLLSYCFRSKVKLLYGLLEPDWLVRSHRYC